MSNYAKGTRNEKRSAAWLRKQNYLTIESRGSHGIFDVIAYYVGDEPLNYPLLRLIQSKTNGKFSPSDVEQLRIIARIMRANGASANVELHNWIPNARQPEVTIIGNDESDDLRF